MNRNLACSLVVIMAVFVTACNDTLTGDEPNEQEIEGVLEQNSDNGITLQQSLDDIRILDAVVNGRSIQGIEVPLVSGEEFTGRITNLQLTDGELQLTDDEVFGTVLASGRIIGQVNGERINQAFEIVLNILDLSGDLENGVCQILYLEIGPIFVDLLGLVVEVPDTIVVEIRAERGPGNLLGNLLCGLLGILD